MREIKFRGQSLKTNEWIFGYYFKYDDIHNIVPDSYSSKPSDYFHVNPDTIGQYTGLNDKNGVEIYEGDIIQTENESDEKFIDYVEYKEDSFVLSSPKTTEENSLLISIFDCNALVVGNIHDNPELIK